MKLSFLSQFNLMHLIGLIYTSVACFQFFKWTFKAFYFVYELFGTLIHKLTPYSIKVRRHKKEQLIRENLKAQQKREKERLHQEALEQHRKYDSVWLNIGFIEEDRATLFKGYEDIKWLWGCHKIKDPKRCSPYEAEEIAYYMFLEINAYRWQFIEHSKWTNEMEFFWKKIMPKKFLPKQKDFRAKLRQKAENDFNSDDPTKASA